MARPRQGQGTSRIRVGSAKLAHTLNVVDDADEKAAERICNGDAATLLALNEIIDTELGSSGCSMMAGRGRRRRGRR